jgi:hypothetical protein
MSFINLLIEPTVTHPVMATPLPSDAKESSKALQASFSDIVRAISTSDPLRVGDELFTASLISQDTLAKVNLSDTPLNRSRILVMSVLDQVILVPDKLNTFMEVLQNSIDESSLSSELQTAMRSLDTGCAEAAITKVFREYIYAAHEGLGLPMLNTA